MYKPNGLVPPTCKFRHRFAFLVDLVFLLLRVNGNLKNLGQIRMPDKVRKQLLSPNAVKAGEHIKLPTVLINRHETCMQQPTMKSLTLLNINQRRTCADLWRSRTTSKEKGARTRWLHAARSPPERIATQPDLCFRQGPDG